MSTSHKRQGLHVTSAETDTSNNSSYLEKHQDSLQEQANQHIYQYPSSLVQNAEQLMESSYQRKLKISTGRFYSGIQEEIYRTDEDQEGAP